MPKISVITVLCGLTGRKIFSSSNSFCFNWAQNLSSSSNFCLNWAKNLNSSSSFCFNWNFLAVQCRLLICVALGPQFSSSGVPGIPLGAILLKHRSRLGASNFCSTKVSSIALQGNFSWATAAELYQSESTETGLVSWSRFHLQNPWFGC